MDIGRIAGVAIGLGSMIISIFMEGGQLVAYWNIAAFIIIAGGSLSAVMLAVGLSEAKRMPALVKITFFKEKTPDAKKLLKTLVELANIVRKDGYMGLEPKIKSISDPFLKSGLKAIADGFNESSIVELLETEIQNMSKRHKSGAEIFNMIGGYAPTMGIIGTVLGLVNMLMHMGDLGSAGLGHAVAVAFIATLYGIIFANLIFLPMGSALKMKSDKEIAHKRVILRGVLLLHAGESPRNLEDKIKAMLGIDKNFVVEIKETKDAKETKEAKGAAKKGK